MKTRPFNAATHKPEDKLVCGGDPVTELIVGTGFVGGVRVCSDGQRGIARWSREGGRCIDDANYEPLEVLIPEPEKPREWWVNVYDVGDACMHPTRAEADAGDYEGMRTACIHVREVPDPEEAKAVETTEGADAQGKGSAGQSQVGSPSTHIDYVPLHNGVPQWDLTMPTADAVSAQLVLGRMTNGARLTGPVVECIVKPKPMTFDAAEALLRKHQLAAGVIDWLLPTWLVNAIVEAANGRAEGV